MIEKTDKSQEFIDLKGKNNPKFISYQNTSIPGNYHVYSGKKLIDDFSVNVNPVESVTKYIDNNEFEDYLHKINFKGHYIKVDKKDDPAKIVLQSRFGSELWKYFLLIALILALIEMMIARNSKKEMVNLN